MLETLDYSYVIEYKLEGTAEEALRQIEEKHYALLPDQAHAAFFKVGVNIQ